MTAYFKWEKAFTSEENGKKASLVRKNWQNFFTSEENDKILSLNLALTYWNAMKKKSVSVK